MVSTENAACDLQAQVAAAKHGDHLCSIYETQEEQFAATVPYVREALRRGDRCGYVIDDRSTDELIAALTHAGLNMEAEMRRGAFMLMTKRDAYLKSGTFDPHAMIAFIRELEAQALRDGYQGFSLTGEMTWALGPEVGCDRLIEYEALLNEVFPGSRSLALCQYNRQKFPAEIIRDVIRTHPKAVVGNKICDNPYFEPPHMVLGEESAERRVNWMLDNLQREWENEQMRGEVAARRRLQAELAEQKQLLERMVDHVPAGISYLDRAFVFQWLNPLQADMFRLPADELLGHSIFEVFGPETYEQIGPHLETVLETGEPYLGKEFLFRYSRDDDRAVSYWDFSYMPVFDERHEVAGIMILALEVSERVKLVRLQHEKIEALEQADLLKDQFLSILSHELRTPLNAIQGFGSILNDGVMGPLTPEQHQYLEKMLRGADTLLSLVNDLLDMSRIQAGKFQLEPQPMSMRLVVEDVVSSLTTLAAQKEHTLTFDVRSEAVVVADAQRIRQILTNLVNNAIKFTPNGGRIHVSADHDAEGWHCRVTDNGEGIAPQDLLRLFQPFTQVDMSTTRRNSGTGLGLSICKALVEAHGGRIGVMSDQGAGSTFWFRLPANV